MTTASWTYELGFLRGFDLGVDLGARPALGAVRRLRSWSPPGDPQAVARRRLAAEVEHVRLGLAGGVHLDELRRRLERCAAVLDGEAQVLDFGVLAEARRAS